MSNDNYQFGSNEKLKTQQSLAYYAWSAIVNQLLSYDLLPHIGLWVAQIFYLACFVPQIITNMRSKSGTGVSELLLIGYLNAYLFMLFYLFCMDLPLAYKILVPLQTLATVTLILQRLWYDSFAVTKRLWLMYGVNVLVFMLFIPWAYRYPYMLGASFGWFNFIASVLNQLPQMIKMYRTKSVRGFNFLFVVFTGCAALCETIIALFSGLPIQTQCNAIRGVVFAGIFTWQFKRYRTEPDAQP